jgi:hypothetical protein
MRAEKAAGDTAAFFVGTTAHTTNPLTGVFHLGDPMTYLVAVYAGSGINSMELVEVSADQELAEAVTEMMLTDPPQRDAEDER